MAIKNRVCILEKKVNTTRKDIVVVFPKGAGFVVKRDGTSEVNKPYKDIDEIKKAYKNKNCFMLIVNKFVGGDVKQNEFCRNIEIEEMVQPQEVHYDQMIETVKERAKMLENLGENARISE